MKSRITVMALLICLIFLSVPVFAETPVDDGVTTTGLRMQPYIDKLKAATQEDLDKAIAKYTDSKNHWAKDYIAKLLYLEIVTGDGISRFYPERDISVAEFLTMTVKTLGYRLEAPAPGRPWYENYIKQAIADRLIDEGEYKNYNAIISREQASKIIYRACMLKEPAPENQGEWVVMKSRIRDYAQIGNEYKDSLVKMYLMGIYVLPESRMSNPKGNITRAQATTLMIKLLDLSTREKFELDEDEYFIDDSGRICYPAVFIEPVKAINYINNNLLTETDGYINSFMLSIKGAYRFYESFQEYYDDPITSIDMALDVRNTNMANEVNWPYYIVIWNREAAKTRHYAFLVQLFKYLFEEDSEKAIQELDRLLNYAGSEENHWEIKLNNRYLGTHYSGGNSVSIGITCIGGLNRQQFNDTVTDMHVDYTE